jgi:hypothetical protein
MRQGIVGGTGLSAPPGRLQQNWVFNGLGEGDHSAGAMLAAGAEPRVASGRRVMQYRTLGRTGIKVRACPWAQ